jgi:hypothetical protein
MRWRRPRRQTSAVNADGKGVSSWPPDAEVKFAGVTNAADDGGQESPAMTAEGVGRAGAAAKTGPGDDD